MAMFFGQDFESIETDGQDVVDIPVRLTVEHCERLEEECVGQLSIQEAIRATSAQTIEVLRSEVGAEDLDGEIADPIVKRLRAIEVLLQEGVEMRVAEIEPDVLDEAVSAENSED